MSFKYRHIGVSIFILLFCSVLLSQPDTKTDSLRIEYQKAKSDTLKIKTLFKLGYQFLNGPSDSLIYYFTKALTISDDNIKSLNLTKPGYNTDLINVYKRLSVRANIEIGIEYFYQSDYPIALEYFFGALSISEEIDDQGLASECYSEIGIVYKNQGKYDEALTYNQKALTYAEMGPDTSWIAACLVNNGTIYFKKGYFTIALNHYVKALKIFETLNHQRRIEACYLNIGKIHYEQNDQDKALKYFNQALKIAIKENEKTGQVNCYLGIGKIYSDKGQYDTARNFLFKSVELAEELGYRHGLDDCYINIGYTFLKENDFRIAEDYYKMALKISKDEDDNPGIAETLNSIAHIYYLEKHYKKALEIALQSLNVARGTNYLQGKKSNYQLLSQIYEAVDNTDLALKYFKLFSNIKDSLFSEGKYKAIKEIETKFETEKRKQQLVLLTEKNHVQLLKLSRRNRLFISSLIVVALIMVIGYILFRNSGLKARHKAAELEQKMLRSQMNPHFIFNSLIAIQSYIYKKDPVQAGDFLAKFADLVRIILEGSRVEFVTLEKEIRMLKLYFELQNLRFENKCEYKIEVGNDIDQENLSIPPMLAQPFIENAIEHGLRHKKEMGFIHVAFQKKDNCILLTVEDDGVGRAKASEIEKGKKHKSIAMAITKERLGVFRKKFKKKFVLYITDLQDKAGRPIGTKIIVEIPFSIVR